MQTVTFVADGKTKEFYFTFPYFMKSDIIIEVNSKPATNYNLIGTSNGLDADIPFSGGRVLFNKPPKVASVITIRRNLPLTRIVDYQPTSQFNPKALNQDLNYLMEVLKDMKFAVEYVRSLPTDIANTAAIDVISRQIEQIVSSMDEINTRIEQIGTTGGTVDLTEINNSIESLTGEINTLNTQYNELKTQMENMETPGLPDGMDYVIESQLPTAENNYTWYRKYKSGWVEQGGYVSAPDAVNVALPIPLTTIAAFSRGASLLSGNAQANHNTIGNVMGKATISSVNFAGGGYWRVCGIA